MSDSKKPIGCIGLLMVAMFLGTFLWIFTRILSMDAIMEPSEVSHGLRQRLERKDAVPDGEDFTTMDAQLVIAQEKKQTVTQIRLEGTPAPLDGAWTVKEVGYDVVVLDGPSGVLTLRVDAIVGVQVEPSQETPPIVAPPEGLKVDPQVEK